MAAKTGLRGLMAAVLLAGLWVVPGSPAGAQSCQPGTESDFNGDGVTDVAIADPDATVDGSPRAGRVHVVYGGGESSQTISQDSSFVGGAPEPGDQLGFALASVDWNQDGCTDLVVGAPFEDLSGGTDAGHVRVLLGSPSGFGPNGEVTFTQNTSGMPGGVEVGDQFGYSLAAGTTSAGDPYMVIGSPGEDLPDHDGVQQADAGAAHYVRASEKLMVHQDQPGVSGVVEAGDQYGLAVAATPQHVVVAGPGEAIGDDEYAGTAQAFSHDVAAGTVGVWNQAGPEESGAAEANDWCGRSLSMAEYVPPDGSASGSLLALGCPGEAYQDTVSTGRFISVDVDGTISELATVDQDVTGVGGTVSPNDYFGWSVQVVNRSPGQPVTWRDLLVAVGVPGEDSDGLVDDGAVQVFSAVGQPGDHDVWAEDAGMVAAGWAPTAGGRSGQYVGGSADHLYVADPYSASPAVYAIPWQNLTDDAGQPVRVYEPGADGLPTTGVGRFGGAIA